MTASGSDGAAEWDDEGDANWTREQPPPLPTLGLECTHPGASINADFEVRNVARSAESPGGVTPPQSESSQYLVFWCCSDRALCGVVSIPFSHHEIYEDHSL